MENVFKKQLEPLNARVDNLAAAVSSLHDVFKGDERLLDNTDVTVCANGIKVSHERIDAILKQLIAQLDRSGSLQVHATKVTCHCTHTAINENMQKLRNRIRQVCCHYRGWSL